jgi:hypothetical protein
MELSGDAWPSCWNHYPLPLHKQFLSAHYSITGGKKGGFGQQIAEVVHTSLEVKKNVLVYLVKEDERKTM